MSQKLTKSLVKKYLDANLFEEMSLNSWPDDERARFLESFGNIIEMRIWQRILKTLNDQQKDELEQLLSSVLFDEKNEENLAAFLFKSIPTFDEIIEEEVAKYKHSILTSFQKLKKHAENKISGQES